MDKQGYPIKDNVIYEDNQIEIRMLKNGRHVCTGNSRHMHIMHFFVEDQVDKGGIWVEYCHSEIMLANFFTKPLQRQLFKKFRDLLMGYAPLSSIRTKNIVNQGACGNRDLLEIIIKWKLWLKILFSQNEWKWKTYEEEVCTEYIQTSERWVD